jgi:hypothetical protein
MSRCFAAVYSLGCGLVKFLEDIAVYYVISCGLAKRVGCVRGKLGQLNCRLHGMIGHQYTILNGHSYWWMVLWVDIDTLTSC